MNRNLRFFLFGPLTLRQTLAIIGLIGFVCLSTSCISNKNLRYFSNLSDSEIVKLPPVARSEATIMPDDLLEIKIAGANEATAALLNSYSASTPVGGVGGNTSGNNNNNSGYLVDQNGDVEFPIMGKIRAGGLTREEFKERLRERVSKYLKDPLVSVRFTNFRFTVLGEVKTPGSFVVPNERVTILEALGLAGDMTTYSRRSGVRVLRDSSSIREIGIVDFSDKSLFNSKYYYLQRNDVLYVEAEKYKGRFEDFTRVSTILATIVSLVAITITIIGR